MYLNTCMCSSSTESNCKIEHRGLSNKEGFVYSFLYSDVILCKSDDSHTYRCKICFCNCNGPLSESLKILIIQDLNYSILLIKK